MDQPAALPTPESAVAGMLAALRLMAGGFLSCFGAIALLAKSLSVYGEERARALRWLHDMECVARRLLLVRAALFAAPAPLESEGFASGLRDAPQGGTRPPKEGDAVSLFGPNDDPEQWRVSFRLPAPPEPAWMRGDGADPFFTTQRPGERRPSDRAPRKPGRMFYYAGDGRPLAERFEALRRVIEDLDHYAAKLARRLHLWRGRKERRRIFLRRLSAPFPFANEAGLDEAHIAAMGQGRTFGLAFVNTFCDRAIPDHARFIADTT